MSYADTLESYMLRMELPYEKVSDDTWVVGPDTRRHVRIVLRIDEPIVLFTVAGCTLLLGFVVGRGVQRRSSRRDVRLRL